MEEIIRVVENCNIQEYRIIKGTDETLLFVIKGRIWKIKVGKGEYNLNVDEIECIQCTNNMDTLRTIIQLGMLASKL